MNTWPFPAFPNPQDKPGKGPKFNPNNHEDAPFVQKVLPNAVADATI